ncbi:protein shisa-5-like [Cottoperca gobio]|uniref:Protein shisa-5-like n=1 Tax=Cottoperca gobio TaxID=56716 RepID=A0A6J2PMN3_COTGO|nr:protein shisa-5-like [Cottoperca gobio]
MQLNGAGYCSSFVDTDGYQHLAEQCGSRYCCGNCKRKYCCSDRIYYFSQAKQERCQGSYPSHKKTNRTAIILGSIIGAGLPILFCVGLITCCVAPCCLCYKKCRKGHNRNPQTARFVTTVVNVPQQPLAPSGYQPSYPGYQPVPAQPGYGGLPNPTAPPSYIEAINPVAIPPGLPMLPFPGQPYAPPPPHTDEFAPLPYNPSYGPNP